jgi:4'-phosphopantetheinyl transferase
LSVAGVYVWVLRLPQSDVEPSALRLLSAAERAALEHFALMRDRRRYGWSHVALRLVLAEWLDRDPANVELARGPSGKPRVTGSAVEFSLAHAGDLALVACGSRAVGVDVEPVRVLDDPSLFTPAEKARVDAGDGIRLWTRKEALLKATGEGLLGRRTDEVETDGVPGWRIVDLDPAPGYVGAVAVPR